MKTSIRKTIASLQSQLKIKCALIGAVCGLGLLSTAAFGQPIQLDLGNNALASNGTGFTKVGLNNYSVVNGNYYEWDNVAGTTYTLSITNVNQYGGTGTLDADGFYNISATGPAYFTLSGLPAGNTVTIYACYAWNSSGKGGKFEYGGVTNIAIGGGAMTNPSISTLTFIGRATVDVNGKVSGRWYGQSGLTGEGQVGAMIFDVEPCQPAITMNGSNPLLVPQNSTYHDPGATAVDSCSGGALTVTTNGTVDATTIGTYTVTYKAVSDGITNTATRTVNVVLSDFLNLDLANGSGGDITPAGFVRLNRSGANMTFSAASVGGTTYTVGFTNVGNSYGGTGTIDKDGYLCNAGTTDGFYVSNLVAGSQVTLYACWAWDGANNAAVITYAGAASTLNVGTGITLPSPTTFMNCGTAVADGTGVVRGTWTGKTTGNQGQIGGMIFAIQAPVGHTITILPSGVTNSCGSSATFVAAAPGGATYQWYNNFTNPIAGATNTTLVLTGLHPSASGNYTFTATATNSSWTSSTSCVVSIYDIAPPLMTMGGNTVMIVPLNSTWTDPGITAYDTCAGNYLTVTTNGTVNTSVVGEYDLTYKATTGDGVSATNARSVIVIDTTNIAPDVQLALDFQSTSDYWGTSSGFTALQLFDINQGTYGSQSVSDPTGIGSSLVLSFGNISSWNQSPYLGYSDISTAYFYNYGGSPATFTLSGLAVGSVVNIYAVYGYGGSAKAAQIIYGGSTNLLTTGITTNSPNPPTQADFQFIRSAIATNGVVTGTWYGPTDPASQGQIGGMIINVQSIPAHSVAILPAESTPQCGSNVTFTATVSGEGPFTYRWYDNHTNLIAGATNATYTLVNVRATSAGNYTAVAQNAFASATNIAIIDGVVDTALPVMALNGPSLLNILVNSTYVDAGATAYDLCAQGSLTVSSNNPVDTTTIGSYTVTYTATTADGNTGTLTRTVNVTEIPNVSLNLDLGTTDTGNPPAPAGYTLLAVGGSSTTAVNTDTFADVAGSIYSLTVSNFSQYNLGNTNEPLTTCAFFMNQRNNNNNNTNPVGFALSGVQPTLKVTLYAIYGQDGPGGSAADVFFGGTNAQIVSHGDPGQTPSLTNFTRIGATLVGSSGVVNGYWTGTAGSLTTAGEVGAMVFIVGTNTPPVASPIAMSAIGGHHTALTIIGGASAPTDADGDPLTITAVQSPTPHSGTVTIAGTNVIYTSPNAFSGTDTFTYTVGDGYGGFSTATVTVTVTANSPPVVSAISMNATNGHLATLKIIGGANAPTDPNGDSMTVTAVQNPSAHNGTVTTDGTNVTYISSFVGIDTFTYTVGDGYGGFSTATVTVTVADTNQPPVAYGMVMGAASGLPATLKIIGGASPPTDPDGDTMTVTAVQSPTQHSGTVTTDGTNVTYTSGNGFTGTDTFTYTVGDGRGGFSTATVTVSVVGSGSGFNVLSSPTLNGGVYQVGYQGIPYAKYVLLNTPSLAAPVTWTPVITNTANASGVITFSFTPSQGTGFYRTSSLP